MNLPPVSERTTYTSLNAIFNPQTVAVIGATETPGSVGRTVLWNLISNPFGGTIYPVNLKRPNVLGIKAYPSVKDVPEPVDLAVVVTRAQFVPDIVKDCAEAGVKGMIIISAGFKEMGAPGIELERKIMEYAALSPVGMRIIGPNCLGLMNPLSGLNATFAGAMARPGNVGFISQSGALCTAILDWSFEEMVGFSAFVSIGSMLDVGWGDLINYLGNDPRTQSIVIYMETIGDARAFMSAAREVALTKPIIIIKAGRTEAAAKAAASHTGSLTGSDEVLDAAFKRCGVLRVNDISEVFYMAEVLAKQPRPKGPNLTIVTNAGGPGVLATDALIGGEGQLTTISEETMAELNELLPPHWSRNNPIDILGDADAQRYAQSLEIAAKDKNSDGMLVILTPQDMTDPTQTAEELKNYSQSFGKPLLASWMGGADVAAGERILNHSNIPTFAYPDTAARVFNRMWRFASNLRGLYETPTLPIKLENIADAREKVSHMIEEIRDTGRTILTEFESKQLLAAYGIPTVATHLAETVEDAVKAAETIGYPVVLKLNSYTVTHKTDVGGVQLNLPDEAAVRAAYTRIKDGVTDFAGPEAFNGVTVQPMVSLDGYELIIGSSIDVQFGPVLLFGMGGTLVEVFKDRALGLPPLNSTLARRMMEQTKIYTALKGVRGRSSVDMAELEEMMVLFSYLVVEQQWIKEIDINPLLASPERILALDARVLLYDVETQVEDLPKLAIRPYPQQYIAPWVMKNGQTVTIRPLRPEDEGSMVEFHKGLSDESIYFRFFNALKLSQRISHDRLAQICFTDYDREIALVPVLRDPETGNDEILGVARLTKIPGTNTAEFGLLISDHWQGQGLGSELLERLIQVGKDEQLEAICAVMLPENTRMQTMVKSLGFITRHDQQENVVRAQLDL